MCDQKVNDIGCQWSDQDGRCTLYDGTIEMPVDEDGFCKVEEDENPNCEDFESDWRAH